jgi:hypothetical protein
MACLPLNGGDEYTDFQLGVSNACCHCVYANPNDVREVTLHLAFVLIFHTFWRSTSTVGRKLRMNPLAAALLAAQGWDVSRLRKQSPNIERGSPSNEGSNTVSHFGHLPALTQLKRQKPNSGLDINALLNNPAILQALNKQLTTSAVTNESPQEWRPEEGGGLGGHGNGNEHLTPGQTTRFGRISRPPVAVPPQSQLALLQQILQGTGESSNAAPAGHSAPPGSRRQTEVEHGYGSSSNYGHSHSSSRQNVPVSTHPARATAVKRPHSTLRESSIPPRSLSPDLRSRGSSEEPLVRPTPPTHSMGRPRKGDPVPTKEERAQRRRINNQHSGESDFGEGAD